MTNPDISEHFYFLGQIHVFPRDDIEELFKANKICEILAQASCVLDVCSSRYSLEKLVKLSVNRDRKYMSFHFPVFE